MQIIASGRLSQRDCNAARKRLREEGFSECSAVINTRLPGAASPELKGVKCPPEWCWDGGNFYLFRF